MSPVEPRKPPYRSGTMVGAGLLLLALSSGVWPQASAPTRAQPLAVPQAVVAEEGVRWQELSAGQRAALKPLDRDWRGINAGQKQKWLEIASKFPSLQPDEKGRIQARMAEWARLSTEERRDARVNFQQAKRMAPQDRQAQWQAYQSLPAEERRQLAARARAPSPGTTRNAARVDAINKPGRDSQQAKSNIVPNPFFAAPPKPVAPTVLQAQPGATTTLISKRPAPPAHQQTGMPKIAASPNFVDKATLLPKRGPQGAATRSASASAAEATQRR